MTKSYPWLRSLLLCGITIISTPAIAQISPDNTLGAESSRLTPNVPIGGGNGDRIDGGATRGSNLFHSFSDFNINDGQRVYFANPNGIQNILTRVTGGNASNILGTLGVDGGANLFLLNPNGIIFGQNASLDLRGSFVGTTANAIGFGEQGFFSATNPAAPPILTVNPSALLYTQLNNGGITNRAPLFGSPEQGSRFFVGGNVTFDGGVASVVSNRLELGGLAGEGTVGLTGSGNQLQLNFPQGVPRADVVLQNSANAYTSNGGEITVEAGNLNLSGNSFIETFLDAGEGSPNSPAGDVVINATGAVTVDGKSAIGSFGFENSLGDSGNITIDADSIRLNNTSEIYTRSEKNRGSIRLNTISDVTLDGGSLINTFGTETSIGNSGDITINARNINLSNSSLINSGNIGQGRGGKTTLQATDTIALASDSTIDSSNIPEEPGVINSEASGEIEIAARSLTLDGQDTYISSINLSEGRAGDIRITTDDSISLNGNASVSTATNGQGDAGDIELTTRSLALTNGSFIDTLTIGSGNSGSLLVNASDSVTLSGTTVVNSQNRESFIRGSNISTSAFGSGNSGQIIINTGRLSILDGSYINTATNSESGQGGDLTIKATEGVEIIGASSVDSFNSDLITASTGSGNAGRISIDTRRLSLGNGASILASNSGSGRGGDININATDSIEITANPADTDNADGIFTSTAGSGDAGDLSLRTQRLSVRNGASVSASALSGSTGKGGSVKIDASDSVEVVGISNDGRLTSNLSVRSQGSGAAGNITVNSPRIDVRDRGAVTAQSNAVDGGDINLKNVNILSLRRGGNISATAGANQNSGNGGNINIDADFIIAVPNENSDITANAFQGRGGNIKISTQGIFGIQERAKESFPTNDITASSTQNVQGQIDITEPNVQPTQGLVELPASVLDASDQIAQTCPNGTNDRPLGEFVVTGRGGSLPPNPIEPLAGSTSLSPLASLDGDLQANTSPQTSDSPVSTATPTTIVEAQGWVKTEDGKIALVAHAPQATPVATTTQATCPVPK